MITVTKNSTNEAEQVLYDSVSTEAKTVQFAETGQADTFAFYCPELTLKSMELDGAYNFEAWVLSGTAEINNETVVAGDKITITDHPSFYVRTRMDQEVGLIVKRESVHAPIPE